MQDGLILEPARSPPTAEDRRRLRHLPLLSDAADDAGAQLIAAASVILVVKDHEIVRQGAKPGALLTVLSGRAALIAKAAPDQCTVLALLDPGDIVMPATVIQAMPYPLSAIATETTRIASIPIAEVRAAMSLDPGLAVMLAESAAEGWRQAIGQLKDQRLLSAPQRFAAHLVRLAGGRRGKVSFEIGEGRKTLASLLGMTPENLSRTIGQLRAIGVILNGRHVDIADVATVNAFARRQDAAAGRRN